MAKEYIKITLENERAFSLEAKAFGAKIDSEEIELDLKVGLVRELIKRYPNCIYTDLNIRRVPANLTFVNTTLRDVYRNWEVLPSMNILKYNNAQRSVAEIRKRAIDDLITVRLTCTVVRDL